MKLRKIVLLFSLSLFFTSCSSKLVVQNSIALSRAHSHNDYAHARPLLDALEHGFASIEADVHVLNNELYVCHNKEEIKPERTLRALYLDPLLSRVKKNNGAVYDKNTPCYLFIDIKTDADSTYAVLDPLLRRYKKMFTEYGEQKYKQRALSVILSGNRPKDKLNENKKRYATWDGRLTDLHSECSSALMAVISDKWTDHFTWRGHGALPQTEKIRLDYIINQAHLDGRKIRFWATDVDSTGDQTALWKVLYDSGVDLINTDKLTDLKSFLLQQNAH